MVRLPNLFLSLGPLQLQQRSQNRSTLRHGTQLILQRRNLQRQSHRPAPYFPSALRSHLEHVRRRSKEHVHHLPRLVEPPAAHGVQSRAGAVY